MTLFRTGVDIGGTFTDVVFIGDDGIVEVIKVASTPEDYSIGVINGVTQGMEYLGIKPKNISELSHGFTVATNAILEGKGEPTALITTFGFRDILELTRIRTPNLYDLYYQKPTPLVERRLRLEVRERINYRGDILENLNVTDVDKAIAFIENEGIKSVAISLLHSYANPVHENIIADAFKNTIPEINLSISSEILPEMREYERTSTTVINGYVKPVVEQYLLKLNKELKLIGINVPLTVMQSNGGLMPLSLATSKPIYCIESGPAAGVVGAHKVGRRLQESNLITFDMGGTTAKASIIENHEMLLAPEYEVGGGMNIGHRLLKGSGYMLRVPTIDIAEVSAGGGSIAWVDKAGGIQSGPQSAGAVPGPVCYNLGGKQPTVTDANVVLGYLNPKALLGGNFPIDSGKAHSAIDSHIAKNTGLSLINAARGVHSIVNSNMGRALRSVSSERGRDPRKFSLMAFGGGGPIHAAGLAETLGISRILIPPSPGVFSAFGLLFADIEHHFVRTHFKTFDDLVLDQLTKIVNELIDEGKTLLTSEGFAETSHEIKIQLDMKYSGQTSELTITIPNTIFNQDSLSEISEIFMEEHEKTYGYRVNEHLQLVCIRVIARGSTKQNRIPDSLKIPSGTNSEMEDRNVYFNSSQKWIMTPIIDRIQLDSNWFKGPLIIEEYDSTTVIPPLWKTRLDEAHNIVVEKYE